jgi:hypothetical protein
MAILYDLKLPELRNFCRVACDNASFLQHYMQREDPFSDDGIFDWVKASLGIEGNYSRSTGVFPGSLHMSKDPSSGEEKLIMASYSYELTPPRKIKDSSLTKGEVIRKGMIHSLPQGIVYKDGKEIFQINVGPGTTLKDALVFMITPIRSRYDPKKLQAEADEMIRSGRYSYTNPFEKGICSNPEKVSLNMRQSVIVSASRDCGCSASLCLEPQSSEFSLFVDFNNEIDPYKEAVNLHFNSMEGVRDVKKVVEAFKKAPNIVIGFDHGLTGTLARIRSEAHHTLWSHRDQAHKLEREYSYALERGMDSYRRILRKAGLL